MTPEHFEKNRAIPGWLSDSDIIALSSIAKTIENGTIIELGPMHGRSSFCLAVSSPTSKIYSLDYWSDQSYKSSDGIERINNLEIFRCHTSCCENIAPVPLSFNNPIIPIWPELVDMVFIDACHTNPDHWACTKFWLSKIKPGGIICGHDYFTSERDGTVQFPDITDNVKKLELQIGKSVSLYPHSCIWSFNV